MSVIATRALGHKQPCLGFFLPAGRAGDDRHFAAQSSHSFFLCSFQRDGAGPIRNLDTIYYRNVKWYLQ